MASSSNIGSIAKRLVLTMRRSRRGLRRAVGERAQDLLLLLGTRPEAGLRLVVDGLALDLVDDLVEGGLVADPDRVAAQDPAVDDEGDLGDVRVRGAPVHLVRELDDGVRPVVEQPFEAAELAFRVGTNALRDLHVLALDDGPHASPPRARDVRGRV